MGSAMSTILVGCSGWSYPHWRDPVYARRPSGEWLERYAEMFPTTEVNATFYRLPGERMVRGWAQRSPDGFVFSIKVSRYLTHVRRLQDAGEGLALLLERLAPLADAGKLGPFLWQLPPTFKRDDDRLAAALAGLPAGRHCFEFRHESWFCEPVERLLAGAGAALVFADHPERGYQTFEPTADWVYVRFHHGRRGRRGNYAESELRAWAERIGGWGARRDVYAYFDNDWEGFAVRNALRMRKLLGLPAPV
jgi:uncharacterized protein YecE (DUF72 family)